MTSIRTNVASMAALATLRHISDALDLTRSRMASGERVGQSSENAAYWSIAATMKSDDKALGAVQDALNLGSATVDVAYEGMQAAISVTDEIKAKLVSASQPGVDKDKVNSEIEQLKGQLKSIASSATFNGVNWLTITDDSDQTAKLAASFYRDLDGGVFLETIENRLWTSGGTISPLIDDRSNSTTGDAGILTSTRFSSEAGASTTYVLLANDSNSGATEVSIGAGTTSEQLTDMIKTVDGMLQMMADSGANFGSIQARMEIQTEFTAKLRDWMSRGIGTLVDANMNEEATRLKALTTQQQLTLQALSIANSQPQSLLTLFN
ncbi:flagellin [Rhizobium sp. 0TCS1.26]|uniref:flagellin N-terminal helical domain-containing protein n=1 Tax=Rhizobium sp. 0TCS1.26 TaxID=3142623 RepID=UPI003D2C7432